MTRADVDDADLAALADCASGGEAGLSELYSRHAASCFGLALSILRDRDHAQDVVREAYLALWRQAGALDCGSASVGGWLLLTTRSAAIDRLRRQARREAGGPPADRGRGGGPAVPVAEAAPATLSPEMRDAVQALPAPDREAFALAFWAGCTQPEIAQLTLTALGTVRTRTMHAMTELTAARHAGTLAPAACAKPLPA